MTRSPLPTRCRRAGAVVVVRAGVAAAAIGLAGTASPARGAVITVPGDQPTIQLAIDAANPGDEIVLAAGIFDQPGDRNLDFGGKPLTVRSTDPLDPAVVEATIIDCLGAGRAFTFQSGETASSMVRGVTIRNGRSTSGLGGAILCDGSHPTIANCVFEENMVPSLGQYTGAGGAVYIVGTTAPVLIQDCLFTGNTVTASGTLTGFGGAMAITDDGAATVTGCTFELNTITPGTAGFRSFGGAVSVGLNSQGDFSGCAFRENAVYLTGGAAYVGSSAQATFADCTFEGNTSDGSGGAVVADGGSGGLAVVVEIDRCTFSGNYSTGAEQTQSGFGGGGVLALTSTLDVDRCIFSDNSSTVGGGLTSSLFAVSTIRNSLFVRNQANDAAGVSCSFASITTLTGCTVADNSALTTSGSVSAFGDLTSLEVTNCIIYGNSAPSGVQASMVSGGVLTMTYTDVEGGWPTGPGNADVDPQFVDPIGDDYRLMPGSPVVDVGDDGAVAGGAMDLDGSDRILDGDLDGTATVDMGAYELPPDCLILCPGERRWTEPLGGDFHEPLNWDVWVPQSIHPAIFDLAGSYAVTFAADAVTDRLVVHDGAVTLDLGQAAYDVLSNELAGAVVVGEAAGDAGALSLLDGQVAAPTVRLGSAPGADGALAIGADAILVASEDLCIGCQGTGAMTVTDNGLALAFVATVGDVQGAVGTVLIDGPGAAFETPFFLTVERGAIHLADGGRLDGGLGGIVVLPAGRISGDGTIMGDVVTIGSIAPGTTTGVLHVAGDFAQSGTVAGFGEDSGSLLIEIGAGAHDVLEIDGAAQLGGGLLVTLAPGADPQIGESFVFLDATGGLIDGDDLDLTPDSFDVAFLPGFPGEDRFMRVVSGGAGVEPAGTLSVAVDSFQNLVGFDDPDAVPIDGLPMDVVAADLDGNGFTDLAIALPDADPMANGSVLILLNSGTGGMGAWQGFGPPTQYFVGRQPSGIAAGRLDGDGAIDLAVTNRADDTVFVLHNDGSGGFAAPATVIPVGAGPTAIAVFELDGDGDDDLAVTNGDDDTVIALAQTGGGFMAGPLVGIGKSPAAVDPEDIDDDRDEDLVIANRDGNSVSVVENIGGGALGAVPLELIVGDQPIDVVVDDLDGDGRADIITVNQGGAGTVSVILREDDGSFTPSVDLPVGADPRALAAVDLEQDGDADLAVIATGEGGAGVVQVLRNDTDPGDQQLVLANAEELDFGADPVLLTAADLDNDTDDDLVVINGAGGGEGGVAGPVSAVRSRLNSIVAPPSCAGDTDASGSVDIDDIVNVVLDFGTAGEVNGGDVDGSGLVDIDDVVLVVLNFGPCPGTQRPSQNGAWLRAAAAAPSRRLGSPRAGSNRAGRAESSYPVKNGGAAEPPAGPAETPS